MPTGPLCSTIHAQMAYTVRTQQQEPPVMVVDPALARYLASQEQGVVPPPPPGQSVGNAICCALID